MSYAFWCSKCKVDHAGECPPAKTVVKRYVEAVNGPPVEGESDLIRNIRNLVKALEVGSYNVSVSPDDPGTALISYVVKMRRPIHYIPITFRIQDPLL